MGGDIDKALGEGRKEGFEASYWISRSVNILRCLLNTAKKKQEIRRLNGVPAKPPYMRGSVIYMCHRELACWKQGVFKRAPLVLVDPTCWNKNLHWPAGLIWSKGRKLNLEIAIRERCLLLTGLTEGRMAEAVTEYLSAKLLRIGICIVICDRLLSVVVE